MCTCGSICVRSPLPSLVTITERAGFGDQEVGAGDADIGGKEVLAQHLARLGQQGARLGQRRIGPQLRVRLAESGSTCSLVRWMAGAMMWLGARCGAG